MNKQKAIELLQQMAQESFKFANTHAVHIDSIVEVINQIHEPQKVVVPKCVGEWIEKYKNMNCSLRDAMTDARNHEELNTWFWGSNEDKGVYHNQETFARAWLDGYIVQEQLYTVEIPDPNGWYKVRCLTRRSNGKLCIDGFDYKDILLETRARFTESEIKQDFEWAWQFAKEVE